MGWFLRRVTGKFTAGICLAPFGIYIRKGYWDNALIQHERIHWMQQMEMLILFFYLWYGIEYIIRRFQYTSHYRAYYNISFEREANKHEHNPDYSRKPYGWVHYLRRQYG